MTPRISSIYTRGPAPAADPDEIHRQAQRAYQDSGGKLILVNLDRLEDGLLRDAAREFGKRIYGEVRK